MPAPSTEFVDITTDLIAETRGRGQLANGILWYAKVTRMLGTSHKEYIRNVTTIANRAWGLYAGKKD